MSAGPTRPARIPPPDLPGLAPEWSRLVEVPGAGHDLGSKVPSKVTDVSVASVDAALRHIGHC